MKTHLVRIKLHGDDIFMGVARKQHGVMVGNMNRLPEFDFTYPIQLL